MKKGITFCVLLWAMALWAAEPVGEVVDFIGEASVLHADQTMGKPFLKQPVFVGDILETKKNGAIKILFKDDTLLTLKENSKTVINEYFFEAKTKKRRAVFNILFGKIRTVVGRFFGKEELVELKTPTAIAGIRGTDVGAVVTKKTTTFYCFSGLFNAFNIASPEKVISVSAGTFTDIFERAEPTPPIPTPQNIENQKDILFDIPLSQPTGQAAETKGAVAETTTSAGTQSTGTASAPTTSAGTQVVQTARQEIVTQSSSVTVLATQTTPPTETVLQTVANTSQTEEFTTNTNPSTTTSSGTETTPGGSVEATNPTTITITLPTP